VETEPAGPKVLVVDDDEYVTSVVERALRRDGYRMATAADGERGLQLLREWRPDAAILDIVMPGLDGLALCRRARSERPDLGILILTARDDSADQIVGLDAGAGRLPGEAVQPPGARGQAPSDLPSSRSRPERAAGRRPGARRGRASRPTREP